jgi:hypothetical protein
MQQAGLDPNVTVKAEFDPPVVAAGQPVTYRVTVTAMIEGVALPDNPPAPPGLTLTQAGRGFNYGSTGGILQPRTTVNYRVAVKGPGTYVMPSYQASANGKQVTVPEARLTVLPAGAPGAREAMRLLVELPQEEFYIGQSVLARLVLLDPAGAALPGGMQGGVQGLSQPQVTGDAVLSEQTITRQGRETRSVNGRMMVVSMVSILVTPIKEGRLEFTAQAYAHLIRPGVSPALGLAMETVLVNSDPVSMTVRHLPKEGELPGFTGGIGTFHVETPRLSTNTVRAGEPLTLTVQVRGDGNLTRLIPPKLDRARGWQAFPPLSDNPGALQMMVRGAAIFTYTLIPLNEQVQATPPIPFCYFEPRRKAYVDATIPPVPVRVLPAPGGPLPAAEVSRASAPGIDDPDAPGLERDLIMTGLAETPGQRASSLAPLQTRPWFLALQLVPASLLGGLWLWDRRRRYLARHPDLVLKARARRGLRRHLRHLRRAAMVRDGRAFAAAAVGALREAWAPFEAANPDALVCADVLRGLPPAEREGAEGQLVRQLFAAADAQRFLDPAPDGTALLQAQPQIEALLAKWRNRL